MLSKLIELTAGWRAFFSRQLSGAGGRMQGLDALRGLAAIVVVAYHYTCGYPVLVKPTNDPLWFTVPLPALGVQIFFVISGFVIFMTLERSRTGKDFFMSRFARLYPPFIFCMLLTACAVFLTGFNPQKIGGLDVLFNLPLVVGLLSKTYVDPSYWTLTIEVCFYAMIASFFYLVQQRYASAGRGSFDRIGGNPLVIALLAWLLVGLAGRTFATDMYSRLALGLNFQYGHMFVAGIAMYGFSRDRLRVPALILAMAALIGSMPSIGHFSLFGCIKVVAIATLIWAASRVRLSGKPAQLAGFLGGVSYSLYLLHQVIGFAVIYWLEGQGVNSNLALLAAFATVLTLAYLVRRLVELPLQKKILHAYAPRKLAPAAAPLQAGPV